MCDVRDASVVREPSRTGSSARGPTSGCRRRNETVPGELPLSFLKIGVLLPTFTMSWGFENCTWKRADCSPHLIMRAATVEYPSCVSLPCLF